MAALWLPQLLLLRIVLNASAYMPRTPGNLSRCLHSCAHHRPTSRLGFLCVFCLTWIMSMGMGYMLGERAPPPPTAPINVCITLTITSLVVPLIAILGGACGANVIDAVHQLRMIQKFGGNLTSAHGTATILVRNTL